MLLQFSVNNFRSIKDTVTFSMNTASNEASKHSFQARDCHLLNSAVIYGANASGKSNVLKAMSFMRNLVLNKPKITQSTDDLPHQPFRLNTETEQASSYFEIVFFLEDVKYRYGFEADSTTVYAEWLYSDEKSKESRLFERDNEQNIHYVNKQKFKEGVGLKVLDNHLFIWKCDQNNGDISKKILQWFNNFNLINGLENEGYLHIALKQMENTDAKSELLKLVKIADLGIDEIEIEENDVPQDIIKNLPIPEELKQKMLDDGGVTTVELQTRHKKFSSKNQPIGAVLFKLSEDESQGTQKFFALSAPILDTLDKGKVLLIDELDASLHPMLTECFIKLFNNKDLNKHNAQLIFVTHDIHLLSVPELFERDQIWFTEKDQYGSTNLYSLLEFRKKNKGKDVRATDNLEKHYLQGRYGAVPYIGEM
ncbi:AAA15 family ATPase/GTPase [Methylobacter tundripaludum]|uniref:AAA15 family ATPase/GTPase n=1 Tax=Methylobacter tundripaludum TaxID=173365 RepID=A0A2S6H7N5_9GAMM|nr:ATP-binding protein [Methylobacter tundripaludum]PPK73499.1 AAA15 family ATPase/GTPase [Methylobacter tundripaludum]